MSNPTVYTVKVYENRTEWRNEKGQFHRIDGPAIEWTNGNKEWRVEGKCHRLDGPAREYASGYKAWYVKGKFNREEFGAGKTIMIDGQEYQLVSMKK